MKTNSSFNEAPGSLKRIRVLGKTTKVLEKFKDLDEVPRVSEKVL